MQEWDHHLQILYFCFPLSLITQMCCKRRERKIIVSHLRGPPQSTHITSAIMYTKIVKCLLSITKAVSRFQNEHKWRTNTVYWQSRLGNQAKPVSKCPNITTNWKTSSKMTNLWHSSQIASLYHTKTPLHMKMLDSQLIPTEFGQSPFKASHFTRWPSLKWLSSSCFKYSSYISLNGEVSNSSKLFIKITNKFQWNLFRFPMKSENNCLKFCF